MPIVGERAIRGMDLDSERICWRARVRARSRVDSDYLIRPDRDRVGKDNQRDAPV